MKRFIIVTALWFAGGALAFAEAAQAEYWIVGGSRSEDGSPLTVVFVDATSIAVALNVTRASVLIFVSPHSDVLAGGHEQISYEFDCDQRRARQMGGTSFQADGAPVDQLDATEWATPTPNSLEESTLTFSCAPEGGRTLDGAPLPNGFAPETASARVFAGEH